MHDGYEAGHGKDYLNRLLGAERHPVVRCETESSESEIWFSKRTLAGSCETLGIRYEHLPELGIASEERRELKTRADYDALHARMQARPLPKQGAALAKIPEDG